MLKPIESFDGMSLKVVAVRTADNSDFAFEFPAACVQTTPSALPTPGKQQREPHLDPSEERGGWSHGGINE